MTDQSPTLPPPSAPDATPKPSWWKREAGPLPVWAWLVGALVGLAVFANLTAPPKDKEASADTAATAVATSAAPAATQPATPATEPTTTVAAPEPSQPPTTIDDSGDKAALAVLLTLMTPDKAAIYTTAIAESLEPAPFERVDIVSAREEGGSFSLVIEATSGYQGEEHQRRSAEDGLANLASVWAPDGQFGQAETVKVALDYTVDGKHWVIPDEAMRAVANRQMSPADALDSSPG